MARRKDVRPHDPPGEVFGWARLIQYEHDEDGVDYEHKFGRNVAMQAMPDGSLRIYKPGSTVWSDL